MKNIKKLFFFFFSLMLLLVTLSVGVYSLQSATLNVSGSLGYVKHGPAVANITGSITGAQDSTLGATTLYVNDTANQALASEKLINVSQLNTQKVLQFGELQFADTSNPVTFNLTITSKTDNPIAVDVDFESFNFENVSKTMTSDYLEFITTNGGTTNISFTLSKIEGAKSSNFSGSLIVNINQAITQTITEAGYTGIIETETNTLIRGCQSTVIPSNVEIIGNNSFSGCTGLTSITIPSSVTSIGKYTFRDCINLTSVTFQVRTGWYIGTSVGAKTTSISSTNLANTSTAATYLKSTYDDKYWTRV